MNILLIGIVGLAAVCIILAILILTGKKRGHETPNGPKQPPAASGNVLEAVSDGVVTLDKHGAISFLNPAAGLLAGWAPADALGIDHALVFKLCDERGEPYTSDVNPFSLVFQDTKPHRDNKATMITKGSQRRVSLSMSVSPLFDKEGQLSGAVGILRDISEEKQAEKQRAEFISTASHEMRTPLASIEGYLALALNENVSRIDAKARDYLNKAHESTRHLGSLFQDLLTSAKAEDGRLISHPEVIEIGGFLKHLSEDLRFVAQKKQLSVEYILGVNGTTTNRSPNQGGSARVLAPLYYVHADSERLREVITNLFDNAVKYTESGKITIGLTGDDNVVQLYIRDTGKGIAQEDIPHLFQKFYRVDNTATRQIGGTGLGLFICRKIVELYNGRIWVESEVNKGSTFYINLPRLSRAHAEQLAGGVLPTIVPSDSNRA